MRTEYFMGVTTSDSHNGGLATSLSNAAAKKDPRSYKEAMSLPDANMWRQACDAAMQQLERHGVWELVEKPENAHVLASRWILKRGSDTGQPLDYEAHLVARGSEQEHGKEFDETHAETVSVDVVRLMLSLVAQHDLHMQRVRVKSALLYGELEHEIYMLQPEGYDDRSGRVCRLKKPMEGLKQAHRQWYLKLSAVLKALHFDKVADAPGLFVRTLNGKKTYILVYVADLLILSTEGEEVQRVTSLIGDAFEINALGFPASYLSLHIERTPQGLAIHARNNTKQILDSYRDLFSSYELQEEVPLLPSDAKRAVRISQMQHDHLPLDPDLEKDAEPLSPAEARRYRSAIGSLNDLASRCRPDILFATTQLSQHLVGPNKLHWRILKGLLKYLDSSQGFKLFFSKTHDPKLVGYSSSTMPGELVRHPHGGCLWHYGESTVYWCSYRERRACAHATDARMYSTINALEQGARLRKILIGLGEVGEDFRPVLHAGGDTDTDGIVVKLRPH